MTLMMQAVTMAAMLLSGLGMGAVFDGYRVVSNELKLPRFWLPVFDMIYWMAAAVIVYRVLYASNNGELRAYVFIGLAAGVLLYHWLLSKLTISIVKGIITAVRAFISFVMKCIDLLIVKPVALIYKIVKLILGFIAAFTVFLGKIVLQLLRPFWKLIVWLTAPVSRPIRRWLMDYLTKWKIADKMRESYQRLVGWFNKSHRR